MLRLRKVLQAASGKKKGCHRGLIVDGVKLEGVYSGTKDRMTRWRIKFKYQDDFKMKSVPSKQRRIYFEKTPQALKFSNISLSCLHLFWKLNRQFRKR
jgi:hypothetical protein